MWNVVLCEPKTKNPKQLSNILWSMKAFNVRKLTYTVLPTVFSPLHLWACNEQHHKASKHLPVLLRRLTTQSPTYILYILFINLQGTDRKCPVDCVIVIKKPLTVLNELLGCIFSHFIAMFSCSQWTVLLSFALYGDKTGPYHVV